MHYHLIGICGTAMASLAGMLQILKHLFAHGKFCYNRLVMNFVDYFSLVLHRVVAEKMRSDEREVLRIARDNLERWLKSESFAGSERVALLEWREILENSTPEEIRKIITQDTDEGQRLRSSSPFAGVLSEAEREKIWSECAEIKTV